MAEHRTVAPPRGADRGGLLEIDLGAVEANWRTLVRLHAGGAVGAVLKADAYGMGARPIAERLLRAGCRHFFVATFNEARAIQPAVGGSLVAVLHGLAGMPPGLMQAAAAVAAAGPGGPVPVLNSLAELRAWGALAQGAGRLPAILHFDTGMARLGFPPDEARALTATPALLDGLDVRYVMSHLAASDEAAHPMNAAQARSFRTLRAALPPAPASLANSGGILLGPDYASDLARPGAALLGLNVAPDRPNPLRPAVRLRAPVLQVRTLAAGEPVGYGATWRAVRPSRIATVGIGYADGWLRAGSNRGEAVFDGVALPLVGRVSMDLTTFDATDAPALAAGAWVDLISPDCPVERVAEACGTAGYEVLTALGQRASRRWHG